MVTVHASVESVIDHVVDAMLDERSKGRRGTLSHRTRRPTIITSILNVIPIRDRVAAAFETEIL